MRPPRTPWLRLRLRLASWLEKLASWLEEEASWPRSTQTPMLPPTMEIIWLKPGFGKGSTISAIGSAQDIPLKYWQGVLYHRVINVENLTHGFSMLFKFVSSSHIHK
jgi:hypothetical protein